MKSDNFEDWTFTELVDYCAGDVLQKLLVGKFREGLFRAMELAVRWRAAQDKNKKR